MAETQRGWKGQPFGRLNGWGIDPLMVGSFIPGTALSTLRTSLPNDPAETRRRAWMADPSLPISVDIPLPEVIQITAKILGKNVRDVVVMVLDRPRHEQLIADVRATGARIRLIGDGDLSAGITAAVGGSGVHAVMGTGGAPEGVLTAAAMRCLNGEIFARLVVSKPEHEERCRSMGITDFKRVYTSKDLAPGKNIIFAATGVTEGTLMRGVRFFGDGVRTSSVLMQNNPHLIRFIESIHVSGDDKVSIRF
jgi:fructose-1,6-bisphosphatase/sedoheptulose 1,7-bisphosphatase-like protein